MKHPDIPELEGTFPVVLYFGSQADADEFIALFRLAKPGLVAKSLASTNFVEELQTEVIGKSKPKLPPPCTCTRSDAWRCAVDRHLPTVSCHCSCHRQHFK